MTNKTKALKESLKSRQDKTPKNPTPPPPHPAAARTEKMKLKKALKILDNHNKWRRGNDKYQMANPTELGKAIDTVVNEYQNLYTKADVIKAAEMGEINYIDAEHITTYLDEAKNENE